MDEVSTVFSERTFPHTQRYGHVAAGVDGNVYMWGGMESLLKQCPASSVVMLDTKNGSWEEKTTSGVPPAGVVGSAWITVGTKVYTLGGRKGITNLKNTLYQLDLLNMEWSEVRSKNPLQGPEGKTGCGMVSLGENMLVVFGGQTLGGYTNELHIFNLKEGTWLAPPVTGTFPPPCAYFSFTKMDEHHVAVYGGWVEGQARASEVYILNMKKWRWTKLKSSPPGRVWHAACCIGGPFMGTGHPRLFVVGGLNRKNHVLSDGWILDIETCTWTEVHLPKAVGPRFGHTVSPLGDHPLLLLHGGKQAFGSNPIEGAVLLQAGPMEVNPLYKLSLEYVVDHFSFFASSLHYLPAGVGGQIRDIHGQQCHHKNIPVVSLL